LRFTEFNFSPELLEGITASGYETATPIQQAVIPPILAGRDIIASAQTGTGKTAAFLLPIMQKLLHHRHDGQVSVLVIVPTRELAIQISQHVEALSYFTNISSIAVYGGNDGSNFVSEKRALQLGADIIVCTPGRMIAHLNMGYVALKGLQFLVLDEADRMLDMGFQDDISRIISFLPRDRQNLLFSATMPEKIRQLAKTILKNPAEVSLAIAKPPEKINQQAYVVYENQKLSLLKHILRTISFKSALIFCSRKQSVKQLAREMERSKFSIGEMHSDLEQSHREEMLLGFAAGRISILVATDILSRGIDIDTIDVVINYDVPHDGEDYVHRIGRTARAEQDGIAITFIGEKEQRRFLSIEKLLGKQITKLKVPQELGPAPIYQPGERKHKGNQSGSKYKFRTNRNNHSSRKGSSTHE
jgi:ATP-dependent RNA helicase RhlE